MQRAFHSTLLIVLAFAAIVSTLVAAVIATPPTAVSSSNGITLRWTTEDESNVVRFEVLRSDTKTGFILIATVPKLGDGSTYEYVDRSVFKTEDRVFVYKIRAVFLNESTQESPQVAVSYSLSSAAKRTWGSIKAMFR